MVVIINFHSLILYRKKNIKKTLMGVVKASLILLNVYYLFIGIQGVILHKETHTTLFFFFTIYIKHLSSTTN